MSTPRWRAVVEHVVATRPHLEYAPRGEPSGPSEDLRWRGQLVQAAREYSSCVAATFEVLVLAMAQFPALVDRLSPAEMKQLLQRTFITRREAGWETGVAGALVEMGLATPVAWEDAVCGDVAQIQWDAGENPWSGHAVVMLSAPVASPNPVASPGARVLWAFSANIPAPRYLPPDEVLPNARPSWLAARASGIQADYFSQRKAGKDRVWHIARLLPELVQ